MATKKTANPFAFFGESRSLVQRVNENRRLSSHLFLKIFHELTVFEWSGGISDVLAANKANRNIDIENDVQFAIYFSLVGIHWEQTKVRSTMYTMRSLRHFHVLYIGHGYGHGWNKCLLGHLYLRRFVCVSTFAFCHACTLCAVGLWLMIFCNFQKNLIYTAPANNFLIDAQKLYLIIRHTLEFAWNYID